MPVGEFEPSKMCALVLDDKHFERSLSLNQLRGLGLSRVIGVASVHEAWDAVNRDQPDLIFLEWLQIEGEALKFIRGVRASEDGPLDRATPIFMLTARSAKADVVAAREAGVDGYLRKPITAMGMKRRVRRVIDQPQEFVVTPSYVGPNRRRDRENAPYNGARRRSNENVPMLGDQDDELGDIKLELARARVALLEDTVATLPQREPDVVRRIQKAAKGVVEVALQIRDPYLELGGKELIRYLEARPNAEDLDVDAVGLHVAALHQLVFLPEALGAQRDRVAQSLRRMVDKKLRAAAPAAASR